LNGAMPESYLPLPILEKPAGDFLKLRDRWPTE
jgi:hypothetical protein